MMNYWFIPRPKRKLNSVPELLNTFADVSLEKEWRGQRASHLSMEEALEAAGLKRKGTRRDQGGSGGRTYGVMLYCLGLVFPQNGTRVQKLTLAGEAIINGENPVSVIRNQVIKFQYPSAYSLKPNVCIAPRFKIRPFLFLFRLLSHPDIVYLTEEEIGKVVIEEADKETDECFNYVVNRILDFRARGDASLPEDFFERYKITKGEGREDDPFGSYIDIANTIINWLEYTQLIDRNGKVIRILEEKRDEVKAIIDNPPPFVDRPDDAEYFQRKFGIDPKHRKDTRNLIETRTITDKMIAEQKIRQAFISASLKRPIAKITSSVIEEIAEETGIMESVVEATLFRLYPHGAIQSFMAEYFEMAFRSRDDATDFEKATNEIFKDVFGFTSEHVGPFGKTPDVLIFSDQAGYQAIIDNKAYSKYSINNDHHNRMVHNYIKNIHQYSKHPAPLAFYSYIAGGFGSNIDAQLQHITQETGVNGSAVSVSSIIKMIEESQKTPYTHGQIRDIFSVNRLVTMKDLELHI